MNCKIWTGNEARWFKAGKNDAEMCDAYVMFGVALSLDSCLALRVCGLT